MREVPMARQFRSFGGACRMDGGTTYGAICDFVADDVEVLALAEEAPPAQRRPNLLLAAVHFLLLQGDPHPLGQYYDTVIGTAPERSLEGVGEAFRDFCLTHRAPVLEIVRTHSTQTNEVGRCAILLPALSAIGAAHDSDPIALLDLGTSAGLNLLFDRYGYTYRASNDRGELAVGDTDSAVHLECTVQGELSTLPHVGVPALADRAGLDLTPVDAATAEGATWLLACLWPDNLPRFERLRAALALWQATPERPRLFTGDMVDDLARVAANVRGDSPLVVFHSWVAAYLTESRQRDLVETVAELGRQRPVHHLYAELPFETPGLPTPSEPGDRRAHAETALVHIGPDRVPERWANVHPHGTWVRWLVTPTDPTARRASPAPAPHRA